MDPNVVLTKDELDVTPGLRAVLPTSSGSVDNTTFVPSVSEPRPAAARAAKVKIARSGGRRRPLRALLALLFVVALVGAAIFAASRGGGVASVGFCATVTPVTANRVGLHYRKRALLWSNTTARIGSLDAHY